MVSIEFWRLVMSVFMAGLRESLQLALVATAVALDHILEHVNRFCNSQPVR